MKKWVSSVLSLLFVVSLLATPIATISAQDVVPDQQIGDATDTDGATGDGISESTGDQPSADAPIQDAPTTESDPQEPGTDPVGETDPAADDAEHPGTTDGAADGDPADALETPGADTDTDSEQSDGEPAVDAVEASGEDAEADDVLDATSEAETGDDAPITAQRDAQAQALDPSTWGVVQPAFDTSTGTLSIGVLFLAGFEATLDGREDSFSIGYDSSVLTLVAPGAALQLSDVPGSVVTLDPAAGIITVTFTDYFAVSEGQVLGTVTFSGSVSFDECMPSPEPYPSEASIEFSLPTYPYEASIEVEGPECPVAEGLFIGEVVYDHQGGMLAILIANFSSPAAGQQVTLTYPTDKLVMDPGPFDVYGLSVEHGREFVIGTATASDGLITISMIDTGIEGEWIPLQVAIPTGWLTSASCADATGPTWAEVGELEFVANHGQVFYGYVPGMLCNAAPASKVGEWTTDGEGNPAIAWTIDTGDVFGYTWVDDYAYGSGFLFNCEDGAFSVEVISGQAEHDLIYCYHNQFEFDFRGMDDEPYRAVITFTTTLDPEYTPTSYVNCAQISVQLDEPQPLMMQAQASNGLGGRPCFELFPVEENAGDIITMSVDKAEARVGDTLTYTIQVSTTSDFWSSIEMINALPVGFAIDPASITCEFDDPRFSADPCVTLVDGVLKVTAWPVPGDGEADMEMGYGYISGPVTFTITLSGTVTDEAPDVLVNQASSERRVWLLSIGPMPMSMGDPTIIGGGVIRAQASTNILQDVEPPVTPTPDPTGTVTPDPTQPTTPEPTGTVTPDPTQPTTPEPTAPATPGVTPTSPENPDSDPTAPGAVTGLPETGSNGPVAISAIFVAAVAAGILMVAGIGIRMRPRD